MHAQAFTIVCSLITISVVSAFGRDTLAAMAAASVSSIILHHNQPKPPVAFLARIELEIALPVIDSLIRRQ